MKNYYYLLQIAHLLHQLMFRSDLFPKLQKKFILHEFAQWPEKTKQFLLAAAASTLAHFRTVKNFVKRLAESFRNQRFSVLATDPEALGKIQRSGWTHPSTTAPKMTSSAIPSQLKIL